MSRDLHSLAALGLTLTADVKGRSARAPSAPPVRPSEQANNFGQHGARSETVAQGLCPLALAIGLPQAHTAPVGTRLGPPPGSGCVRWCRWDNHR